jgi:hypothetical protein
VGVVPSPAWSRSSSSGKWSKWTRTGFQWIVRVANARGRRTPPRNHNRGHRHSACVGLRNARKLRAQRDRLQASPGDVLTKCGVGDLGPGTGSTARAGRDAHVTPSDIGCRLTTGHTGPSRVGYSSGSTCGCPSSVRICPVTNRAKSPERRPTRSRALTPRRSSSDKRWNARTRDMLTASQRPGRVSPSTAARTLTSAAANASSAASPARRRQVCAASALAGPQCSEAAARTRRKGMPLRHAGLLAGSSCRLEHRLAFALTAAGRIDQVQRPLRSRPRRGR